MEAFIEVLFELFPEILFEFSGEILSEILSYLKPTAPNPPPEFSFSDELNNFRQKKENL